MALQMLRNKELDNEVSSDFSDYLSEPAEQKTPLIVSYVRDIFAINKRYREPIEQEMLESQRRIKGEYPADKLAALRKAGMPDSFLRLTYHKCRDTESWITEIHSSMGIDRTWDVEPDGDVTLPPKLKAQIEDQVRNHLMTQAMSAGQQVDPEVVVQQSKDTEEAIQKEIVSRAKAVAEDRATNMETKILSQLLLGNWEQAFKACINDLSKFKACIMKGPIYRKKLTTVKYNGNGQTIIEPEIVAEFERVSPFNWYPSPNSNGVDDGPAIELEQFQRKDFTKLIGVPGYKEDAIRQILSLYGEQGFSETVPITSDRDYLEKGNQTASTVEKIGKIDGLNFWGEVPGNILLEWGMSAEEIPDPDIDYQVNVKIVNDICYKAVLNPDLMGKKPYGVTSFVKSNDSQWGESPADLMVDIQNSANQAVRGLEYNIATSSGPTAQVNIDMLADGETSDWYPGKVFETISKNLTTPAVRFDAPPMHVDELMRVMEFWSRKADDIVVPSFSANGAVGADKTASGRSMRINAAARNIKLAVENVDRDIIVRAITMLFDNNMRYLDDDSIKGALKIKARGTAAQIREDERSQKLNELRASLSPEEKKILGESGIATLLWESLKSNRLDPARFIKNYADIERAGSNPAPAQQSPEEIANMQAQTTKLQAETAKIKSATILDIAKAEAAEAGQQLDQYSAFTDRLLAMDANQQSAESAQ